MNDMKTKALLILLCIITSTSLFAQKRIAGRIITKTYNAVTLSENSSDSPIDTLYSFSTPGALPCGICWDGTYLWHNDSSKYIYKLNTLGEILDSIDNPDVDNQFRGGGMTCDGTNIWLVGEQSAKLFKIDNKGTILKTFDLPSGKDFDPNGFGIAWDGNNLWHSQYLPPVIYKINPSDGSVISSFVPNDTIMGIEWINNKLYGISVTDDIYDSKLVEIDTITGEFNDSVEWNIAYPLDLCFDNNYIWNVSGPTDFLGYHIGGKNKIYKVETDLIKTSVDDNIHTFDEVKVYPNPFKTTITVESAHLGEVYIINSIGQTIYTSNLHNMVETIDLSLLNSGLYFLRTNNITLKVLKIK